MKFQNKTFKKIIVITFAIILFGFTTLTFIFMPKEEKPFSENENRYLAAFPEFNVDAIVDESFMEGFDEWISDRFFGRIQWIYTKNQVERLSGKKEIGGTYVVKNRLMEIWEDYNKESTQKTIDAIDKFAAENSSVPTYIMIAPTSLDIYSDMLPASTPYGDEDKYIEECYNSLDNVIGINATETLKEHKNEYIYYRMDHHWTTLGAYYAYQNLASQLGYEPYEQDDFDIICVSKSFKGTLYSKTLFMDIEDDEIDRYNLKDREPEVTFTVFNGFEETQYESLYFEEYLNKKDKYSYFMGNNASMITIDTNIDNEKSILIFKDSYANCLIPFLKNHYSRITVVDLRYMNSSYKEYFDVSDYNQVLFLYNCITFSEDTSIARLNLGLD